MFTKRKLENKYSICIKGFKSPRSKTFTVYLDSIIKADKTIEIIKIFFKKRDLYIDYEKRYHYVEDILKKRNYTHNVQIIRKEGVLNKESKSFGFIEYNYTAEEIANRIKELLTSEIIYQDKDIKKIIGQEEIKI